MIIFLLATTLLVSIAMAVSVILIFNRPIHGILNRLVPEDLSFAWSRYLRFAIFVVGVAGGVQIWNLEKYLTFQEPYRETMQLTPERWIMEIYSSIIGTLQSTAMILLAFFLFALIAVVLVRLFESRSPSVSQPAGKASATGAPAAPSRRGAKSKPSKWV